MNGKQLACVVLLLVVGSITYAAQMVHKKVNATRQEADSADAAAAAADSERGIAETKVITRNAETKDVLDFLGAWNPHVQRMQTSQEVEEAVQASVRNAGVFVVSQKFEVKTGKLNPVIPRTVMASLVLEDEYAKTMNWLGDLEKKVPLARINICRMTGGETGRELHIELTMEVPLIDLNVDPIAAAKSRKGRK